jgi:hypothetical protein
MLKMPKSSGNKPKNTKQNKKDEIKKDEIKKDEIRKDEIRKDEIERVNNGEQPHNIAFRDESKDINLEKDCYKIMDAYFNKDNGRLLVIHQLKSFNYFMDTMIQEIIKQFNSTIIYYDIKEANQ